MTTMTYVCSVCGGPAEVYRRICMTCREKRANEEYKTLPVRVWDEKHPAYSDALDLWFTFTEEVLDYAEEHGASWTPERMRLHPSEPTAWTPLHTDTWDDEGDPDEGIPDELADLIEEFNKDLKTISTGAVRPDKRFRLTLKSDT